MSWVQLGQAPVVRRSASMDWSDSQQADYSTYSRELQRREAEQGLQAALNFTAAAHTSVSPKLPRPRSPQTTWGYRRMAVIHGSQWRRDSQMLASVCITSIRKAVKKALT